MRKSVSCQIISSFILTNVAISFAINQLSPGQIPTTELPTVSLPAIELPEGIRPEPLQDGSSVVRSDGSFKFATSSADVDIQIDGFLKDMNGTRSLVLTGRYTFMNYSRSFRADENGFRVYVPTESGYVATIAIKTLLGR